MGPFRFYMCGEYGEENWRPHYHACMFGLELPDRKIIGKGSDGSPLYRSQILEELWPLGHSSFGDVTFQSAAYVARYVMKKVTGRNADEHYARPLADGTIVKVEPEFARMSLRPAIGRSWLEKYRADVYTTDTVRINGMALKPPRYYDKLLAEMDTDLTEDLELRRYEKSKRYVEDNHPDRLKVREQVALAKIKTQARKI